LDWGNVDDAVTNLKKASDLRPGFIMYHLELGKAYAAKKDIKSARAELEKAVAGTNQEPGDEQRKSEAAALLKTL
jgi:tetratricopeptide (TPR) repeat protein